MTPSVLLWLLAMGLSSSSWPQAPSPSSRLEPTLTRVTVKVLGIYSPRGVNNFAVRLEKLPGLARYKFDIPDSLLILEFKPGVSVRPKMIRDVAIEAGYQPGTCVIKKVLLSDAGRGRGWFKPPRVDSRWAFIRWLQLNF